MLVGLANNEEEVGEEDKIFFSVCTKLLTGKNDVFFVAIYDTNMEIDIAKDAITIRRTKCCIYFLFIQTLFIVQ